MPTCIYCLRLDPSCGFTTEHVIPQALGRFEDNLTLNSEVCHDCNQYFGRTLDRFLTRDSAEALLRFKHGLKSAGEVKEMFTERVEVRIPRDGSKWGGVHLDFVPPPDGGTEPFLDLVPQAGFERKDGEGWDYYTEGDIENRDDLAEVIQRECGDRRVVLFDSDESRDRLLGLLEERDIPFKKESEFTGFEPFVHGEVTAELVYRFDAALARAVSKIAVNYLTYVRGANFVLNSDFNAVRDFVRKDLGKPPDFVTFLSAPQAVDFEGRPAEARGHVLALGWDRSRTEILCKVCPFAHKTYLVRLCRNLHGIWREVMCGHFFDLTDLKTHELTITAIQPAWLVSSWGVDRRSPDQELP